MITKKTRKGFGRLVWRGFITIWLMAASVAMAEVKLGTVKVGLETYEDVEVISKTEQDVFVTHSKGFANIKIADLSPESLVKLGYEPRRSANTSGGSSFTIGDLPINPSFSENQEEMVAQMQQQFESLDKSILMVIVGVFVALYLFISWCCHLICVKAGTKPGLLVWLPLLQFFPLLKAARMSAVWFLTLLLPFSIPFIAAPLTESIGPSALPVLLVILFAPSLMYMVWSCKICTARGLSGFLGILLWLPFTSLFVFLYLAFGGANTNQVSSEGVDKKDRAQDTSFFFQEG